MVSALQAHWPGLDGLSLVISQKPSLLLTAPRPIHIHTLSWVYLTGKFLWGLGWLGYSKAYMGPIAVKGKEKSRRKQ